jgi:hypothetical protein
MRILGVDRFHAPVAMALLLLVAESLIGTRRRRLKAATAQAVLALTLLGAMRMDAVEWESGQKLSPRDSYNEGSRQLREGKLRDAEALLQAAVVSNDERLQPAALYNLGHVRFRSGKEALKEADDAGATQARSSQAESRTGKAIQAADAALAGDDVAAIVRAYRGGKGARKEMKNAIEAVRRAMEDYGAVLMRWRRASGDFKSALELRPDAADAKLNAKIVDRHIAALVDRQKMMQLGMQAGQKLKEELEKRLAELGKRLPDGEKKGGEDEDEEPDDKGQDPKEKEQPQKRNGREMALTPEEAMRLLDALKLDLARKLSMGEQQTEKPKDRGGRDW